MFRNNVIYPTNFLFDRGDITDPEYQYSNPWRQGILTFLKMVEYGVLPSSPTQEQIKGVSPVGIAISNVNSHFLKITDKHNWNNFTFDLQTNVVNNLSCWDGYVNTSENDATSFLFNTKRRFDNLIPTSPGGFVAILPQTTKSEMLVNPIWESVYQTDTSVWSDGMGLSTAKNTISTELTNQVTSLPFYVEDECFWQFIEQKDDPDTYFAVLIDPNVLTPTSHTVKLKKGSADGDWEVFDQFGSQSSPLGTLNAASNEISINIPAGSVRILTLKKNPALGIEKERLNLYKIYPNPFTNEVHIQLLQKFEKVEMVIYDITGRIIRTKTLINRNSTISLKNISSGIYFIHLKNQNDSTAIFKLIKL